ncbi:purine-nucleoside phosphorylase [Megalodesulfovibrio gigas]|uniref:Purine nucleoside phosphorylase n=1 Tax=Megalodesulfovibrio gigas (strain ATCC 19364 / DSM 1382 / NCIMB 9332 / VKM B-1759) TaxID=1121448 RepID=T2GFQ5_MEGG1|nr:purine-nucleoside phosphorylase [Megalodesulfovibrio gigas]AGW15118.1 putative purine nucleoside phosphorylase [Megalodesulfovibrio gigas DSM 1382 = ATCC 19364]
MQNQKKVKLALDYVRDTLPPGVPSPQWAIVLGTGLSNAMPDITIQKSISFGEIPGFPAATVASHQGCLALAAVQGVPVWLQCGRVHLYEGHSPGDVVMPIRLLHGLGVRRLLLTNAAGSLHHAWDAGDIMVVADHINMTGVSPLTGPNVAAWGDRFPDMSAVYSPALQTMALEAGCRCGMRLRHGVYIGVQGPQLETPAETRMYKRLGADAIGMSTVLEAIAARHLGIELCALSVLTNKNLPGNMAPACLEDIIAVAEATSRDLARVITSMAPHMASPTVCAQPS